jgi:hypothetical protein
MEDKENEVIDVIRNYINLEKECQANDQQMTPVMKVISFMCNLIQLGTARDKKETN